MGKFFVESMTPPSVGDVIEGTVIGLDKSAVYVDLPPFGTGIILVENTSTLEILLRKINPGDAIAGKVVSLDNKNGYIEISLKEARQAIIWERGRSSDQKQNVYELPVQDANKRQSYYVLARYHWFPTSLTAQYISLPSRN